VDQGWQPGLKRKKNREVTGLKRKKNREVTSYKIHNVRLGFFFSISKLKKAID
jgi:hypothetical protein